MSERRYYRTCGAQAVVGAVLLVAGTWLHPANADPNDSVAAFTEYAASSRAVWVAVHLAQLAGLAAMIVALILLSRMVSGEHGAGWAWATAACGAASLAVAATLQAVDGVALKAMVDRWAFADASGKTALFDAALAVRQIEIGLDSLLSLALGATIVMFGLGWLAATGTGPSAGALAVAVGASTGVAGVLIAIEGYSSAAMLATMLTGVLAVVWLFGVGVWAWRVAPVVAQQTKAPASYHCAA